LKFYACLVENKVSKQSRVGKQKQKHKLAKKGYEIKATEGGTVRRE
jgi:hypothetical protein